MEKRRRHFWLSAMLVGMGIGFLLAPEYPTAFPACTLIGMGIGCLLDSLFSYREKTSKSDQTL